MVDIYRSNSNSEFVISVINYWMGQHWAPPDLMNWRELVTSAVRA